MFKKFSLITIIATIVNVVLFYIFQAIDVITDIELATGDPITVWNVVIASLIGGVISYLLFLLITKVFKSKKPSTVRIVGYILLILSFANPFSIPDVELGMALALNLMHIVIAVPLIELLARSLDDIVFEEELH